MSRLAYSFSRFLGYLVRIQTMRIKVYHAEQFHRPGGFVLACTHLSHLEPFIVSELMRRKIDWMARIEFYKYRLVARYLRSVGAFSVDRNGVPVKAIRSAIHRTRAGRVVGIFPEGGVVHGGDSVLLGGPIKRGACLVALRAGVPIVPVVLLGTRQLTRVRPWIPFPGRQITLWVMFGQPIYPPAPGLPRRVARIEMGERLCQAYRALGEELVRNGEVPAEHRP